MIKTLPCGMKINVTEGECCLLCCPSDEKRSCDSKNPCNPIELCWDKYREEGKIEKPIWEEELDGELQNAYYRGRYIFYMQDVYI